MRIDDPIDIGDRVEGRHFVGSYTFRGTVLGFRKDGRVAVLRDDGTTRPERIEDLKNHTVCGIPDRYVEEPVDPRRFRLFRCFWS